jgi:hypothetical protein
MGQVRVVVTRIEHDGTMHRRMVDTAQQSDPKNWEDLAARALVIQPPYRPIPGTAVYHVCVDGHIIQVGEYDLEGPLRDLAVVVLAIGSAMLAAPSGRQPGSRTDRRCQRGPDDHRRYPTQKTIATYRLRQPSRSRTALAGSERPSCRTRTQTARHLRYDTSSSCPSPDKAISAARRISWCPCP